MAEYEKKVRQILKENGYQKIRNGKGDHEIWGNLKTNKRVAVDHVIKSRHTANAILKEAGINYHF